MRARCARNYDPALNARVTRVPQHTHDIRLKTERDLQTPVLIGCSCTMNTEDDERPTNALKKLLLEDDQHHLLAALRLRKL
jgi:hypothetical protein